MLDPGGPNTIASVCGGQIAVGEEAGSLRELPCWFGRQRKEPQVRVCGGPLESGKCKENLSNL